MNTEFAYTYRDGHNNKQHGIVIASGVITDRQVALMDVALEEDRFFIADQVGFPDLFFYGDGGWSFLEDADHSWHELDGMTATEEPPTDLRTTTEIVAAFLVACAEGWKETEVVA